VTETGGEHEARERVQEVYTAVDRLTPDDLRLTVLPIRDKRERERLLAHLEGAAVAADRGTLLGEARTWLREALGARTLARQQAEAGVWGISAGGSVEDRVEVYFALEDAVSVAATQDLLDPAEAAALADPGRQLLGLEPLSVPGMPGAPVEPPAHAWEPSAADWAAAGDEGRAAVDREEPMGGSRVVQRAVFGVLGASAVVFALLYGITTGQLLLGVLGAGAAAAVAFTFATWRSTPRR
jgi:hypothetical protein